MQDHATGPITADTDQKCPAQSRIAFASGSDVGNRTVAK